MKRVFVFGDVQKPGMLPMSRDMTVLNAMMLADSYKETALLDEIRVIRGNLQQPEILTADLSRLFTYGDMSRNLPRSFSPSMAPSFPRQRSSLDEAG